MATHPSTGTQRDHDEAPGSDGVAATPAAARDARVAHPLGRAKHAVRLLAGRLQRHRWRLPWPRLVVLSYHRVIADDDPGRALLQPGMYVTRSSLERHLACLAATTTVVRLGEWVRRARAGEALPRVASAITFDDGWQDNHANAFPLLRAAGLPATVFLVTDLVGADRRFPIQRLADLLLGRAPCDGAALRNALHTHLPGVARALPDTLPVSAEQVEPLVSIVKRTGDEALEMAVGAVEAEVLAPQARTLAREFLSWDDVEEMHRCGLIEFGSHTCSHLRLRAEVPRETIAEEIRLSADAIRERLGTAPTLFCYPNGDRTPEADTLVRAQYEGAVLTRKGWNRRTTDPYSLRRIGLHEDISDSVELFCARLSGLV